MTQSRPTEVVPHGDRVSEMREASGVVTNSSSLACVLYLLARDLVPTGKLEELIDQALDVQGHDIVYTNGWLAQWAEYAEARLLPPIVQQE